MELGKHINMYKKAYLDDWLYLHMKCNVEEMTSHFDCV